MSRQERGPGHRYPQTPPNKPTAAAMPDVSHKVRLTLPKSENRPQTTLYGDTVAEVVAKFENMREPAMNRAGFMNRTVIEK